MTLRERSGAKQVPLKPGGLPPIPDAYSFTSLPGWGGDDRVLSRPASRWHWTLVVGGILAAYMVAYVAAGFAVPSDSRSLHADLMALVPPLAVAALAGVAAWRAGSAKIRWFWALVAAAHVLSMLGEAAWAYYEVVLKVAVPYPSIADVGYIGYYILVFAGLLALTSLRGAGRTVTGKVVLDSLLFAVSAGALAWELIVAPVFDSGAGVWANLTTVSYSTGDVLLLVGLASILLNNGRALRPRGLGWLSGCLLVWFVADTAFAMLSSQGAFSSGGWLSALWPLGYTLAGAGALVFIRAEGRDGERAPVTAPKWLIDLLRTSLPYVAIPSIAALLCARFIVHDGGWRGDAATIGLALVLTAMVLVRQSLVVRENRRLQESLSVLSRDLEARVVKRTEELAVEKEHLAMLNRVAQEISQCVTALDVIRGGLRLVRETAGCASSAMWLARPEKRPQFFGGGQLSRAGRLQLLSVLENSGMVAKVRTGGGIARLDGQELRACTACESLEGTFCTVVVLPLTSRKSNLGLLCLGFQDPAGYPSEEEVTLAYGVASQLAVALENSRRYDDARRQAEEDPVTGLFNSRGLARSFDRELARSRRSGTPFSVVIMDLDNFKLFNDVYGHAVGDEVLRQAAAVFKRVLRRSDVVGRQGGDEFMAILPDTATASAVECFRHVREAMSCAAFCADGQHPVPLSFSCGIATFPHDGHRMGELLAVADANMYRSKHRGGDCVTPAVAEEQGDDLPAGVFTVLEGLVVAVDNKDHYTWQHSDDVTRHAIELAERVGLSREAARPLRIAGLLHDVGKIGIPDRILRKPGPLNEQEFEAIKTHVSLGEVMIKEIPDLHEVLAGVGAHHERWDGEGYPRGLAGEDIPLLGRILAVSDAYSAMTTNRPYRKALAPAEAREELRRVAGTQLDPRLVEAFLEILDEHECSTTGTRSGHVQAV